MVSPTFFLTSYILHHRTYAAGGAQCRQCRRQDGYHHLNHRLPSFSFHTSFLSFFLPQITQISLT